MMKRLLFLLLIIFFPIIASTSTVMKLEIKGAVGPASSNYLKEGMATAEHHNAQMILIELDAIDHGFEIRDEANQKTGVEHLVEDIESLV